MYSPADIDLLHQMVQDDAKAFREIYERYQEKVYLFAFRLTKSGTEAEEVVQEVFVKLWEKRSGIKIEKNFKAYILTITRNLIFDRLKKAARDKDIRQRIYRNMEQLQNAGVNQLIEKELDRLHMQAVERLSPRKKTVYLLSREEEMTYEQIAEKLGISVHTVRNQMADSLNSIREFISRHPDISCILLASWLGAKIL